MCGSRAQLSAECFHVTGFPDPIVTLAGRYQLSLHIEGTGFIYSGVNQLPRVEVEAAHLGRRLEVLTHQTSSPRAGNFFPRLLLKTHL